MLCVCMCRVCVGLLLWVIFARRHLVTSEESEFVARAKRCACKRAGRASRPSPTNLCQHLPICLRGRFFCGLIFLSFDNKKIFSLLSFLFASASRARMAAASLYRVATRNGEKKVPARTLGRLAKSDHRRQREPKNAERTRQHCGRAAEKRRVWIKKRAASLFLSVSLLFFSSICVLCARGSERSGASSWSLSFPFSPPPPSVRACSRRNRAISFSTCPVSIGGLSGVGSGRHAVPG